MKDNDAEQTLNSSFSSVVTNLEIFEHADNNLTFENVAYSVTKLTLKCRNLPSKVAIGEARKKRSNSYFLFSEIESKKY